MPWLEMSRDPDHGGSGWEFGTCLWSPTSRKGGGKWGYWELMNRVKKDDIVFHLSGKTNPKFVGHSVADSDCYITEDQPPKLGSWNHARQFYRVSLRDYCPLESPVVLSDIFKHGEDKLIEYHRNHSPAKSSNGRFLFFVSQAGRLQCQNGAYLSEVDSELSELIFGNSVLHRNNNSNIQTDTGFTALQTRIGQQRFSQAVRANFNNRCCFPSCGISDSQFLIGAHIARWSDSPQLRGEVSNGLCLCLMHDKAFETGFYTLSSRYCVIPTNKSSSSEWVKLNITPFKGQKITLGKIYPSIASLKYHWQRIGFHPG